MRGAVAAGVAVYEGAVFIGKDVPIFAGGFGGGTIGFGAEVRAGNSDGDVATDSTGVSPVANVIIVIATAESVDSKGFVIPVITTVRSAAIVV